MLTNQGGLIMSVNGISGYSSAADAYSAYTQPAKTTTTDNTTKAAEESGVVYEPSNTAATDSTKKTYTPDTNLIARLKADAADRTAQLESLVQKLMSQQGNAYGEANDMWQFLAGGNYTVTAAAKAQAQSDIAEDGYWGVDKTSDRILDMAKALTGGDPEKIEEMRSAFEKGYKQATKAWGKNLPDISSQTHDAVMSKFDKWAEESASTI